MKKTNTSNLKILAKGAGISVIFVFLGYVIMFFFKLMAARYLKPEGFGQYTLAETILLLGSLLASLGITQGITRYIPFYEGKKDKKSLSGYLKFILAYPLIFSVILALILFLFSSQITSFFNFPPVFPLFLKIMAFALPFDVFSKIFAEILLANKKVMHKMIGLKMVKNLTLLFGMIFIILTDLSVSAIIWLLFLSTVLSFLYCFFVYLFKIKWNNIDVKPTYRKKEWVVFSLPLFFTGFLMFFVSWSDNIVIGKFLDPSQLGIYSIAFSFAMFLSFFQSSFSAVFTPLISENYAKKKFKEISFLFKKSAAWIFGLSFPLFLVMVLYSRQILTLFYGKEYALGYMPLIIASTGFLINLSTGLNMNILMVHKQTRFIFWVDLLIASYNIGMNIFLIPLYGIAGAATASASSMAFQNLIFLWKAKRYEKLRFDWLYNLKFITAGIPAVLIAASVFRVFSINKFIELGVSVILYAALYFLLLIILRTFTKDDFDIVLAVEKKAGLNLRWLKKLVKRFY
jgi:O-antigen/teichoic acid export membrane protein